MVAWLQTWRSALRVSLKSSFNHKTIQRRLRFKQIAGMVCKRSCGCSHEPNHSSCRLQLPNYGPQAWPCNEVECKYCHAVDPSLHLTTYFWCSICACPHAVTHELRLSTINQIFLCFYVFILWDWADSANLILYSLMPVLAFFYWKHLYSHGETPKWYNQ